MQNRGQVFLGHKIGRAAVLGVFNKWPQFYSRLVNVPGKQRLLYHYEKRYVYHIEENFIP